MLQAIGAALSNELENESVVGPANVELFVKVVYEEVDVLLAQLLLVFHSDKYFMAKVRRKTIKWSNNMNPVTLIEHGFHKVVAPKTNISDHIF